MVAIVEERWREERRGRLLDAAARVFSRHPYGQASMDEIAHEAGVGKPTLYRYFPGKDALFAAVFIEALDELEARLDAVLGREDGVEARLVGLVAAILPIFRDHLVPLRLLDEAGASADQSRRRIFRDRKARIGGRIAAALREGVSRGELREVDPDRTAELMIGMIWSAAGRPGGGTDEEVAHDVTDIWLRGLAHHDGPGRARQDGGRPIASARQPRALTDRLVSKARPAEQAVAP